MNVGTKYLASGILYWYTSTSHFAFDTHVCKLDLSAAKEPAVILTNMCRLDPLRGESADVKKYITRYWCARRAGLKAQGVGVVLMSCMVVVA